MTYALITVLHDSAPHVEVLMRSLRAHLDPMPHVVAVDTDSSDAGAEIAEALGAEVVRLNANPGFGPANNAGLERVTADVTIFVNPDVAVTDASLATLAAHATERDALHVPRLLEPDGRIQDSAHPVPGSPHDLLAALTPFARPWRATRTREVGWAIAACVAARTETLRALGPFDPDAFLWYEDLELCLKARASGRPTILHPELTVIHAGQHATGRLPGVLTIEARRRREVVATQLGGAALTRDDAIQALTFALRAPVRPRARAQLRALRRARADR